MFWWYLHGFKQIIVCFESLRILHEMDAGCPQRVQLLKLLVDRNAWKLLSTEMLVGRERIESSNRLLCIECCIYNACNWF